MKEKVVGIVNELQFSVIKSDEDLDTPFDDLGLDSLDVMEIIIKVETDFEINLDDTDLDKTSSVNDLIKAVNDKQ